jgi:aryl-alcohol dehydrogenase-like predicted oxidoreductase
MTCLHYWDFGRSVNGRNAMTTHGSNILHAPRLSRAQFLKVSGAALLTTSLPPRTHAAEAPLISRPIPKSKTNEQMPIIGLGTARVFGRRGDAAEMAEKGEVLKTLLNSGARMVDTAASYGEAEEICGEQLQALNLRSKAFVASKFGERGRENGIASIARSFKRLRTDMIDLMYIHNMVDADTHLPTIQKYKDEGKFRYIGISDTSPNQDKLIDWMDRIDFVEFSYSVGARDAEKRLLPAAKDKGVAACIAIPLGSGRHLRAMAGKDVPEWAKQELACDSFAQLLLKFVLSHPAVTVAIPATSKQKHMLDNLGAGRGPMPDAKQRERIADLWKDV